jgi:hypothetical protein
MRHLSQALLGLFMSGWMLSPSTLCYGETLDNLVDSKAMQDFKISKTIKEKGKKSRPVDQWLRGLDPTSNFASIWTSSDAPKLLLTWAGAKLPYMHYKRPHSSRSQDMVTAEVQLINGDRDTARLAIMIPHRSIAPLVEANVLEEFRRLRPPMLQVVGEKPIPLSIGEGTLYELQKGGASLVIPVAQNGVINITIGSYKRSQILIDIAKGLDIERLNKKLDS